MALKVVLVDSFGDTTRVTDWKPYAALAFDVVNPSKDSVKVGLNVRHAQTKAYATRIDVPIVLKPGRNEVRLKIAD